MSLLETSASFSNADIQQIEMLEIRSYIRQNQEICPLELFDMEKIAFHKSSVIVILALSFKKHYF